VSDFSRALIASSGYERAGFAGRYDRYRPRPPVALLDVLCRYARAERPALVVDLGCGTGLSTRAWSGRAERVIGAEPNPAMLAAAEAEAAPGVEYTQSFARETGLPDAAADIVTCSQSLHWMEPLPVFREAARILRPGGVFAAYDYDWPPLVDPEVDQAYAAYQERRRQLREQRGIQRGGDRWPKHGHLDRMRESGCFAWCRELLLHSVEPGNAERIGGFARSLGLPVAEGDDEQLERALRIDELEAVAEKVIGGRTVPFVFGYRVRLGVTPS
jgi:ubiquinone/menaquinone biosynthesis C-methylase UbiE